MTDTTSIDQANAAIYAADQQLLKDIATAVAAFQSAVSAAVNNRGTGSPSTPAIQYSNMVQTSLGTITSTASMTSVYAQYGLQTDGTPVPAQPTLTPGQ